MVKVTYTNIDFPTTSHTFSSTYIHTNTHTHNFLLDTIFQPYTNIIRRKKNETRKYGN